MGELLRVAGRGFVIVFLTATNVVQVSHGHYGWAFIGGFLISFVWWSNAHRAGQPVPYGALAYGLGAACGTVIGMRVAYALL